MSVITLTFGDMAENHKGMEKIGTMVEVGHGFNTHELQEFKTIMENLDGDCVCELISLSNESAFDASVLVIRNGVNVLLHDTGFNSEIMLTEQLGLNFDTKAFMYGNVRNKHARWNLCYDYVSRDPDYANGQGRIIGYDEVPITNVLRLKFEQYFGSKAENLKIESNYYYDVTKCGIGFHGDSERRKVIGVRLGTQKESIPLYFQWYINGNVYGDRLTIPLNNGDIYIMSEKSVGTDWRKSKIYTLRHATGCEKFTQIKSTVKKSTVKKSTVKKINI
jgi:hypothetical protein